MPLSDSKRGRIAVKSPESFVEVVEASVTNGFSCANATLATRSSAADSMRVIGTSPPGSEPDLASGSLFPADDNPANEGLGAAAPRLPAPARELRRERGELGGDRRGGDRLHGPEAPYQLRAELGELRAASFPPAVSGLHHARRAAGVQVLDEL